jgi:hypothetical protein
MSSKEVMVVNAVDAQVGKEGLSIMLMSSERAVNACAGSGEWLSTNLSHLICDVKGKGRPRTESRIARQSNT